MMITLDEMKSYLRVDFTDEDALIEGFITEAENMCKDILRVDDESKLQSVSNIKIAVMYAVAYLYEHREDADHKALTLDLRSLLFGDRNEAF